MVTRKSNERNLENHNKESHDSLMDKKQVPSNPANDTPVTDPPFLPQQTYYYKSNADQDMIRTALQKSMYFSGLDEEQMETFVQSVQLQQYPPGQIIITEGCVDVVRNNYTTTNDESTTATRSDDISKWAVSSSHDGTVSNEKEWLDHNNNTASSTFIDTITMAQPPTPRQNDDSDDDDDDSSQDVEIPKMVPQERHLLSQVESPSGVGEVDIDTDGQNDFTANTSTNTSNTNIDYGAKGEPHPDENNNKNNDNNQSDHWILRNHPLPNSSIGSSNRGIHVTNLESALSSFPSSSRRSSRSRRSSSGTDPPLPPQSGIPRSIYIIRKGSAQIWYHKTTPPPSTTSSTTSKFGSSTTTDYLVNALGPGKMFGEGGFLFGRQHSASVIAASADTAGSSSSKHMDVPLEHTNDPSATPPYSAYHNSNNNNSSNEQLECWVMDIQTFRDFVLPSTNMRQIFHKYAGRHNVQYDATGQPEPTYVTINDLLEAVNEHQQLDPIQNQSTDQRNFHLIATLYDTLIRLRLIESTTITNDSNRGRRNTAPSTHNNSETKINLNDFCFFFALLARPDPEVDVIFLLMDEHQTGCIGIHDLRTILQPIYPELDFTSQFFQRYFGTNGDQYIRFKSFSQFLLDLQREIGQQAFCRAVLNGTKNSSNMKDGYLSPSDFVQILSTSCGWKLPNSVLQRLDMLYCHNVSSGSGEEHFSYGDFMAFQDILGNLSFICRLISRAEEFNNGPISADDFKVVNREFGLGQRLSRRQVDIIFDVFDVNNDGYISSADIVEVCGDNFIRNVVPVKLPGNRLAFSTPSQNTLVPNDGAKEKEFDLLHKIFAGLQNLSVAAIVGGISVLLLHPIDLIKTRLMNQRKGSAYLYRGPIDCIQQVIRNEGYISFFRGVQPHVLGVALERSIKLQVHHLMQQAFHAMDDEKVNNRKPSLLLEALAGGCAGACQLLVTNPMEITSIRLQLQGETARLLKERGIVSPSPSTMLGVIKDLGFPGVYRGASACLIRDVPFSAIFFPSYVACKDVLVQHNANFTGTATAADIFYAGTIAGIPASLLTTPADVVKCRLQSIARPGETSYTGIRDCVTKMYQNEGIFAFFQGSSMRVLRIAPQFGLSLLLYENLTNLTGLEKVRRPPSNLPIDPGDYQNAFPSLQRTEPGFLEKWYHSAFSRE